MEQRLPAHATEVFCMMKNDCVAIISRMDTSVYFTIMNNRRSESKTINFRKENREVLWKAKRVSMDVDGRCLSKSVLTEEGMLAKCKIIDEFIVRFYKFDSAIWRIKTTGYVFCECKIEVCISYLLCQCLNQNKNIVCQRETQISNQRLVVTME